MRHQLVDFIKNAGVVGAGGGGFPTHVKAGAKVEYILANGAECEPLIHKDVELMTHQAEAILTGLRLMMDATGATHGIIGIKKKNSAAVAAFRKIIDGTDVELLEMGDFYPAGDEYELVQLGTGRLIPPGGIPLEVGCVVCNVETLFNVTAAAKGIPVTHKFVTVAGMVHDPKSFWVPVGTRYRDLLDFAGGITVKNYALLTNGPLMGGMSHSLDETVTKTFSGLIVLPEDHYIVTRKNRSNQQMNRIGKSACDQCTACTEFCPRYLLGYEIQPHKVMRSLGFTASGKGYWNRFSAYCCSCGLCTLYACPEDLYPREACDQAKLSMKKAGETYRQEQPPKIHPMKEYRRVPTKSLLRRLRLEKFEGSTPFITGFPDPSQLEIPLQQHVGSPSVPVVQVGDMVKAGDLIADLPDGSLGAKIHSPLSGKIKILNNDSIVIAAN